MEVHGRYTAIKGFIKREVDFEDHFDPYQVTLTTQSTPKYLHHLLELSRRWGPSGLFSVAVYVPGTDFQTAYAIIAHLRRCHPQTIRRQVDWHLVFDSIHPPRGVNLSESPSFSREEEDRQYHHCSCTSKKEDEIACLSKLAVSRTSYRSRHSLTYPINVLRNVARTGATSTRYLLASDIELYPSIGLAAAFSAFIKAKTEAETDVFDPKNPNRREVYMLPIFEVNSTIPAPEKKHQLVAAFAHGDAQFFHAAVCDQCQRFPGRGDWITNSLNASSNEPEKPDPLTVFGVTKRTPALGLRYWEPIYIGTHAEPLYDERLSWEGKLDKMSQMYELCLLDYDIIILDNAFLVHAPGIKKFDPEEEKERTPFWTVNRAAYEEALWSLKLIYGAFTTNCD